MSTYKISALKSVSSIPRHVALTFPKYYVWLQEFLESRRPTKSERLVLCIDLLNKLLSLSEYLFNRGVQVVTLDYLPRSVLSKLNIDISFVEDILIKMLIGVKSVSSNIYILDDSGLIMNIKFVPSTGSVSLNIVVGYDYEIELRYMLLKALFQQDLRNFKLSSLEDLEKLYSLYRECLIIKDDPDLMIVFGESTFPNFLTFNLAYTEFVFIDKNMYEITFQDLDYALIEYSKRNRRFGC